MVLSTTLDSAPEDIGDRLFGALDQRLEFELVAGTGVIIQGARRLGLM